MRASICVAIVLLAQVLLVRAAWSQDASWALSEAERARLRDGSVLVDAEVANDRPTGDVRAAVQIHATAERVFRTLTDCGQALAFVPHLDRCAVLETAPDLTSQIVEHHIHYGWFMPDAEYVFRAEYERFRRIRFSNVRGDFRENRGAWEFVAAPEDGTATIVTYRVRLVPRFFVPRWMMRSMLKRDLPELMKGLRARSEAQSTPPAAASAQPTLP